VKRAITGGARANTGNVEESVNSPEAVDTSSNRVPKGGLVAYVCLSEARFAQFCRQGTALLRVDPNDKHGIFGRP
jgi:hypothetical protein